MAFPARCLVAFLLVLAASTFGAEAVVPDRETQDLIDRICRQTEDYGFCNNAFNTRLLTPSASIKNLTDISITLALTYATDTYVYITRYLRRATDPAQRKGLSACADAYTGISALLGDAQLDFVQGRYADMKASERLLPRIQANCRTDFPFPSSPMNPLIEKNREMRIFIVMAILAGSMLP